jgi:hypothetical protein
VDDSNVHRLVAMYYNAPSPAIPIKLGQQHDPWNSRQLNGSVQPTSPGYAVYTNGIHSHQQPHHAHSMSIPSVYSQADQLGSYRTSSPNGTPGSQVIGSPHWQQQLLKAEVRPPIVVLFSHITSRLPLFSRVGRPRLHIIELGHPPWLLATLPRLSLLSRTRIE